MKSSSILLLFISSIVLYYYFFGHFESFSSFCIQTHSQQGLNYPWLTSLGKGSVVKVLFEEPVGSGKWIEYDDHWWNVHCNVINHSDDLIESHLNAFVRPSRFARLMFYFQDGSSMEPTKKFYELENEYFKNSGKK
jgi:hypothetical protein